MAIFHYNPEQPYGDNPNVYLMYWGKEACKPSHSFGPGIRDMYKVHFIHQGTGIVRTSAGTYNIAAGQAFFTFPGHVVFYQADAADPWTYSWIGFRGEQADSILSRTSLTPDRPVFPMDMQIMPKLYEMLNEATQDDSSRDLRFSALLLDFLTLVIQLAPASPAVHGHRRSRDEYIHRCLDFLHNHYSEDVVVEQLASMIGLDRKYLSAIFKEAVGLPPQKYLLAYRMARACELLKNGSFTVGEVASSVGYQDGLVFSKAFKKLKGMSPTQYRNLY
ncbi:AraC-like DNA-binding protein [Paenibacillus phyllosphaerae]|uniref:AraC-like DNA-binding protein n=1 Tax=Paenibacillus phyllosphaerae TaxID=274593 RepID=A0A7W5B0X1_9BACL|nr:AraC family transcriptional regulator [Paenibacillus phyllosphaerae]MBB3112399.1 AraC-like DNA-binding protein [Paenibacillus phyllosphaerae]